MGSWGPGQSSGSEYPTTITTDLRAKLPVDDHPGVCKMTGPQRTDPLREECGVQAESAVRRAERYSKNSSLTRSPAGDSPLLPGSSRRYPGDNRGHGGCSALRAALQDLEQNSDLASKLKVKEAKVVEAYALSEPKRPAFLDGLTGDLEEMKEVLERAAQSQAQHEALACQLREENEALQAHLAVTNGEQAELQTEMAALHQALAQASAQSQDYIALRAALRDAHDSNAGLVSKLELSEATVAEQYIQLDDPKRQAELEGLTSGLEEEKDLLERAVARLRRQAAQSKAEHEALACQLREESEALQARLAGTHGEQAELQTEMAALRQALQEATAQPQDHMALRAALRVAHQSNAELVSKLKQSEATVAEQNSELEDPKRQAALEGLTGNLEEEKDLLERAVASLRRQATQSKAEHEAVASRLREESEALQARLAGTNGEQAELHTQMAALRQALEEARAQPQARVAPDCDQGVQTFMLGGPIAADLKYTTDNENNSKFIDNGCWNLIAHYRKKLEEAADLEVVLVGEREEAAEEAEAMQRKCALLQQEVCRWKQTYNGNEECSRLRYAHGTPDFSASSPATAVATAEAAAMQSQMAALKEALSDSRQNYTNALARVEEDSEMIDGLAGTANDFEQKLEDTDKEIQKLRSELSKAAARAAAAEASLATSRAREQALAQQATRQLTHQHKLQAQVCDLATRLDAALDPAHHEGLQAQVGQSATPLIASSDPTRLEGLQAQVCGLANRLDAAIEREEALTQQLEEKKSREKQLQGRICTLSALLANAMSPGSKVEASPHGASPSYLPACSILARQLTSPYATPIAALRSSEASPDSECTVTDIASCDVKLLIGAASDMRRWVSSLHSPIRLWLSEASPDSRRSVSDVASADVKLMLQTASGMRRLASHGATDLSPGSQGTLSDVGSPEVKLLVEAASAMRRLAFPDAVRVTLRLSEGSPTNSERTISDAAASPHTLRFLEPSSPEGWSMVPPTAVRLSTRSPSARATHTHTAGRLSEASPPSRRVTSSTLRPIALSLPEKPPQAGGVTPAAASSRVLRCSEGAPGPRSSVSSAGGVKALRLPKMAVKTTQKQQASASYVAASLGSTASAARLYSLAPQSKGPPSATRKSLGSSSSRLARKSPTSIAEMVHSPLGDVTNRLGHMASGRLSTPLTPHHKHPSPPTPLSSVKRCDENSARVVQTLSGGVINSSHLDSSRGKTRRPFGQKSPALSAPSHAASALSPYSLQSSFSSPVLSPPWAPMIGIRSPTDTPSQWNPRSPLDPTPTPPQQRSLMVLGWTPPNPMSPLPVDPHPTTPRLSMASTPASPDSGRSFSFDDKENQADSVRLPVEQILQKEGIVLYSPGGASPLRSLQKAAGADMTAKHSSSDKSFKGFAARQAVGSPASPLWPVGSSAVPTIALLQGSSPVASISLRMKLAGEELTVSAPDSSAHSTASTDKLATAVHISTRPAETSTAECGSNELSTEAVATCEVAAVPAPAAHSRRASTRKPVAAAQSSRAKAKKPVAASDGAAKAMPRGPITRSQAAQEHHVQRMQLRPRSEACKAAARPGVPAGPSKRHAAPTQSRR